MNQILYLNFYFKERHLLRHALILFTGVLGVISQACDQSSRPRLYDTWGTDSQHTSVDDRDTVDNNEVDRDWGTDCDKNPGYDSETDWSKDDSETDWSTDDSETDWTSNNDTETEVVKEPDYSTRVCVDVAPTDDYTCQEQAEWGKCNDDFMQGYCMVSCGWCEDYLSGSSGMCPDVLNCPRRVDGNFMSCGCMAVDGLGENKRKLLNAGAIVYMLASAMLETNSMDTSYPYGDYKSGDAFNAGVCKQNWGMMRQCHSQWNYLEADDFDTSAVLNSNPALDVQVYNECRDMFGANWWAGHRNGSTGLEYPYTDDIANFKIAMDWTYQMIRDEHTQDNIRMWVNIGAI